MVTDRQKLLAFALLGLVMVLWAGNSIVARSVNGDVGPFTLAFVRWAGACLVLLPFAIGPLRKDWRAIKQHWKIILLLGLLGVAGFNAFLYSGLQYTTATNALLLQAAIPTFVVALERVLFGVKAPAGQVAGVALSTLGVIAIVFRGDPGALLQLHFGMGDALVLCSVAVWGFYTVYLRKKPAISPVSFLAVTFFIGVLAMAPLALGEWAAGMRPEWSTKLSLAFLYVAVLPSLVSYAIYNWAADKVGASRAGQTITLMPLFGAFLSAALLGESLQAYHFAGMACIVAGIVLTALAARRKARRNALVSDGARS